MNDKITGIAYIIVALLIMVVYFVARWFFVYLIWIIAIVLLIVGVYLFIFRK
ncbi:hypothetical protein [Methanobacterium oryzae]|uniref:hypothetical protein n=1 Tax=Methanobacterium oryzae TaxID=69540 RepID=UPI003D1EBCC1